MMLVLTLGAISATGALMLMSWHGAPTLAGQNGPVFLLRLSLVLFGMAVICVLLLGKGG